MRLGIVLALLVSILYLTAYLVQAGDEEDDLGERVIRVEVWNGSGGEGDARRMAVRLRELGFDVVASANARAYAYPTTIVVDRRGDWAAAEKVASALGGAEVVQAVVEGAIHDVTVIVGSDGLGIR
jgi:hypothetical protein